MAKGDKDKEKLPIEPNVTMDEPTVDLGGYSTVRERLTLRLNPVEYRAKKILLKNIGIKIRNAEIAYLDDRVYRIHDCVDYFYTLEPTIEDGLKKAIGAANASGKACVLLSDQGKNIVLCSLSERLLYREIRTPDHMGTAYGGLTYLETRGRKYVSNLTILMIVTLDFYFLTPVLSEFSMDQDAGFYRRLVEHCGYGLEPIAFLVYAAKSSKLEIGISGSP